MNEDYLNELNHQQKAAVEYMDGPELVIAGAGSGKTRVLTYKIVHLLHLGYYPYRILALTFTNKAAREMRERISSKVGEKTASRIWMGTFHSIFSRIIRQNAELLGFNSNYTIYDTSDSKSLIKMIVKDMNLDEKIYKISTVQNNISWAKNHLVSPQAYMLDKSLVEEDRKAKRPLMGEIYRVYLNRCRMSNAMDFDDLLFYMAVLLRDFPDVLRHYQEFFQYVLVDEYQDTNFAQNYIMTMLTKHEGNVCVVGDDAQSIYSFRGANIGNILNLNRIYPNLKIFKLEQNYRSTQNIINAANSLIEKNEQQIRKTIFSENAVGDRIEVIPSHSDYDEAGLVASKIVVLRAQSADPLSEFAVLYRTNAQSRVLEEALRRRNIPYRIYGGLAFYQRKEVKDSISYFKLSVNPNDDEAIRRIINVPARGIGDTTVGKVAEAALKNGVPMWNVLCDPTKYELKINSGTARKLNDFVELITSFIELGAQNDNAEEVARYIIKKTGLLSQYLHDKTPENISKIQNIEELLSGIHEFVEEKIEEGEDGEKIAMAEFLSNISLQTDQDNETDNDDDKVTLMTIHAAKGLEFKNVFVVGVEEDLLPSSMGHSDAGQVEEERRLFYVAITRAKEQCVLTYASSRFMNGQTMICRPSRFLKDIDSQFLRFSFGNNKAKPSFTAPLQRNQPQFATKTTNRIITPIKSSTTNSKPGNFFRACDLNPGMRIMHSMFGEGTIESVSSNDIGDFAIVSFDNQPTPKKLLLKFAKITII